MTPFSYTDTLKENIFCNLCGKNNTRILSKMGSEGLKITSVTCNYCGLVYINPRMPKEWYEKYYQEEYRNKTIQLGDANQDIKSENIFHKARKHGNALAEIVLNLNENFNGRWIEVGSSVGGVLYGFREKLDVEVMGVEPSLIESNYAISKGVPTITSLIENLETKNQKLGLFDGVLCTQSLNHFLNPKFFFEWSYKILKPQGLLMLEVMNFRHQLERAGMYKNAVQIDHVYMFTPDVVKKFVIAAGFDILFFEVDAKNKKNNKLSPLPRVHIRLIAKKTNRQPFKAIPDLTIGTWKTRFYLNKIYIYLKYLIVYRFSKLLLKNR